MHSYIVITYPINKQWLPLRQPLLLYVRVFPAYSMTAANPPFFTILISMVLFFVTFCSTLL